MPKNDEIRMYSFTKKNKRPAQVLETQKTNWVHPIKE